MTYKNRYQKAAYALEWLQENGKSHREAMVEYGFTRKQLISNVASLKTARLDLYKKVLAGELSYNQAYTRYRSEA